MLQTIIDGTSFVIITNGNKELVQAFSNHKKLSSAAKEAFNINYAMSTFNQTGYASDPNTKIIGYQTDEQDMIVISNRDNWPANIFNNLSNKLTTLYQSGNTCLVAINAPANIETLI